MSGGGRVSGVRRVVTHPLLWAVVCALAAVPLLGTPFDFGGFLLCLAAGWLLAHALVGGLLSLRPAAQSFSLHIVLAVAAGVALFALTRGVTPAPVDPAVTTAVSFAAVPAAGWVWLTLIGRVSGLVRADSARRAARLVPPEWTRTPDAWELRLPVVPVRLSTYRLVLGILVAGGGGALLAFVIGFSDTAMRMSPLAIVVVLGWLVGLPVYGGLVLSARSRTVEVMVRVGVDRIRVERMPDAAPIADLALSELRAIRWAALETPTRLELRPMIGPGLVLLFGLARRPAGMAASLPALPSGLRRRLSEAGLAARASRERGGDALLTREGTASTLRPGRVARR
ncbi:hypothetical protein [uncultured Microbacterium sp.]|uniref:hypothetical protein n=1 Tax=uncultured Microbacterium sp. TaxID=191216 RepID=UPI0026259209|nr:hypothetical protein [uncultured Microbacterium sp.]